MNDSKKEDVIKIYLLIAHIKLWVDFFRVYVYKTKQQKKIKSVTFYLKKINLFLLSKFDILL